MIPDHAKAEIFIRLVDSGDASRAAMADAVTGLAGAARSSVHPRDALGTARWIRDHGGLLHHRYSGVRRRLGQPFLFGPGSIHFAHTDEERVPKAELLEAIEIYKKLARQLISNELNRIK